MGAHLAVPHQVASGLVQRCPGRVLRWARLALLGLASALSLVQRLERRGLSVQIKWPNDLLVHGRKLAGLAAWGGAARVLSCVCCASGLGLNVRNSVPCRGHCSAEACRAAGCRSDPMDGGSFAGTWITVTTSEAMGPGASMTCAGQALVPISSFIPRMARLWHITGLERDGALRLRQGSRTESWRRWP